jgi:hypothetical protein
MTIQLNKLSLFNACTCMFANVRKCSVTYAMWNKCNACSLANPTLLASCLENHFVTVNTVKSPLPSIGPTESYRVLGVELNTTLNFTKDWQELKRTIASLI